jgi:DNA-binding NtrC family response regulator
VGGDKEIKVNVRVITATNKDLKQEIKEKKFREDLYHRISVIIIQVPPLSDRKEDIPLLVDKFLEDIAAEYGSTKKSISEKAIKELQKHPWTGNIRELRNVVERLVIMCGQDINEKDVIKYAEIV